MKTLRAIIPFAMVLLAHLSASAQSFDSLADGHLSKRNHLERGGVVTGGGSSYQAMDGRRLADAIYATPPTSPLEEIEALGFTELEPGVQKYMKKVRWFVQQLNVPGTTPLFEEAIYAPEKKPYLIVPPGRATPCRMALPGVKEKAKDHAQYACTFRGDTYILDEQWKKHTVLHNSMRILHERMWVAFPKADQKDISAFVGGLESFLLQFEKQQRGNREEVSKETIQQLHAFYEAVKNLGLHYNRGVWPLIVQKKYKVVSGGAVVFDCPELLTLKNGFLSFGTTIVTECGQGALEISNTVAINGLIRITLPEAYKISNSKLTYSKFRNVNISNSTIADSTVKESTLSDSAVTETEEFGPARVTKSKLHKVVTSGSMYAKKPSYLTVDSSTLSDVTYYQDTVLVNTDLKSVSFVGGADLRGTADAKIKIDQSYFRDRLMNLEPGTIINETRK